MVRQCPHPALAMLIILARCQGHISQSRESRRTAPSTPLPSTGASLSTGTERHPNHLSNSFRMHLQGLSERHWIQTRSSPKTGRHEPSSLQGTSSYDQKNCQVPKGKETYQQDPAPWLRRNPVCTLVIPCQPSGELQRSFVGGSLCPWIVWHSTA